MLWAPSGVAVNPACTSHTLNYPFQFTSRWSTVGAAGGMYSALITQSDIRAWASAGDRELGLWWGNSVRPVPWGTCDTGDLPVLDPCNTADVTAADTEMGDPRAQIGPYAVGARAIGLDAFSRVTPDVAYTWLARLRERNPEMRFITEPTCFDVLHTLAPAFVGAFQVGPAGSVECGIVQPNAMADFLNKGHETWAHIHRLPDSPRCSNEQWFSAGESDRLKELAAAIAGWGFVPVIAGNIAWEDGPYFPGRTRWHTKTLGPDLDDPKDEYIPESFEAAPTWESTVPALLQD